MSKKKAKHEVRIKEGKQPRSKRPPPTKKKVKKDKKIIENFSSFNPSWQFCELDFNGRWGCENITSDELVEEIYKKLILFEGMNWSQIEQRGSHNVNCNRINTEAKKRLSKLGHEDLDELFSLRLTGKKRLWGIKRKNVLQVIWYDPRHEVCPALR